MRRAFLTAVLAIVFVAALLLPAWSQRADRPRRVGILLSGLSLDPAATSVLKAPVDGLREHGWEDGRNVNLGVIFDMSATLASLMLPRGLPPSLGH